MYNLKRRTNGLHLKFSFFMGINPITLLGFPGTIHDALDTPGAMEGSALRLITYYLEDEAQEHDEESIFVMDDPEEGFFI